MRPRKELNTRFQGYTLTATSSLGITGSGTVLSGTTGQFPYFAANGTTLTATSSLFIATNGAIGVGTTSPQNMNAGSTVLGLYNPSNNTYLSIDSNANAQSALEFRKGNVQKWVLYSPASSNDLRLFDGTADRITFLNGGNVGIGTSTPWAKLAINSTGGIPQFVIGSSTTQFIVDQNGNVGIGTTGPRGLLDVQSTSQASGLTTGYFYSDASGSGVSTTSIQIEKGTGYGGRISGYLSQGVGSGLLFTTLNGGVPLDVMTLTSAGNVGIGGISSGPKLRVFTSSNNAAFLTSSDASVQTVVGYNDNESFTGAVLFGGADRSNSSAYQLLFLQAMAMERRIPKRTFAVMEVPLPMARGRAAALTTPSGSRRNQVHFQRITRKAPSSA